MKSYPAGERLYVLEALSQTLLAPLNNISMKKGKEIKKSKEKKRRQGKRLTRQGGKRREKGTDNRQFSLEKLITSDPSIEKKTENSLSRRRL